MLTLNDGRSELWQWDTGRKLTVDTECSQVHFSNKVFGRSIDIDVVDGVASIPDILLQTDKELTAWAFVGTAENGYTKISKVFKVNKRNKPADYVFTPPEQTTLAEIMERLDGLESIQDPDAIKNAVDDYLSNNPIQIKEEDPTVPDWAKQPKKPTYTAKEVGSVATVNGVSPDENGNVEITIPDSGGNVDLEGYATEQWVKDQKYLTAVPDGYAKTSEIPKKPEDIGAQPSGNYALKSEIPSVPVQSVNNKTGAVKLSASDVGARPDNWMPSAQEVGALPNTYTPPNQTAEQVGADPKGTATSAVSQHNTADDSHNDIRLELKAINDRLTAFFDSDNQTLDELSEIVAYITSNKSLIDSITTSKVSVADIINNLTSNVSNKPLSAAQGVVLKGLIDAVSKSLSNYQPKGDYALKSQIPTVPAKVSAFENDKGYLTQHQDISHKLDANKLPEAVNDALEQAKASGDFDGEDGEDGYSPVRGVDYWTPEDIAAIDADIATELAKRGQLTPEFAESMEWLETNGDQTKLYVLPDGMIYAYMTTEKEVESGQTYTNLLPTATDTDRQTIYGEDYDGDGAKDGYLKSKRLSSSGTVSTKEGAGATGFISAAVGDVLRAKNLKNSTATMYVIAYDSSNVKTGYVTYIYSDNVDGIHTFELSAESFGSGFNSIRITAGDDMSDVIITINQEIKEGGGTEIVTVTEWASTGHAFVPADYEDRIIAVEKRATNNTARIAALEKSVESGGADETEAAALARIQKWDKPIYDPAPVTLISDDRVKPALTTNDRTISAIYAKYRALMAEHPDYITETNMGKSSASDTFAAVDMLRFDFCEPGGLTAPSLDDSARHETKPTLIFLSGIHREWVGVWGLYYALEEITTNPDFDDIRRNAHIIVIPCANPFGLTLQTAIEGWEMSHVNANGVAIHNNFGVDHRTNGSVGEYNYGGSAPYSEPETQYIDAVMAEYPDAVAFVSCHNNDYSTYYGSHVIWASSATYHMCNMVFRLVDKLSKAWLEKYGQTLKDSIDQYKINMDANDYRLGRATMSTSKGTEQLNATKYGIMGVNLEISRMMKVFSGNTDGTSEVMTHGAEVYANFIRTLLWSYDHKDKKEYAPNLPWSE